MTALRLLPDSAEVSLKAGAAEHKEAIVLLRHLGESVAEDEIAGTYDVIKC